jgi:hypothetical protein
MPDNSNNLSMIYSYTEKEIDNFNKSIDNLSTKLTATLGFSGVLLKFGSDIPNDNHHFLLRCMISILLFSSIGCCASGLLARDAGKVVRAKFMLEDRYYCLTQEDFKLTVLRQWHEHIEDLEKLLRFRRNYLNVAIISLVICGSLFAGEIVVSSIH